MHNYIGQVVHDLTVFATHNPAARDFVWRDDAGHSWKWSAKMKLWTYYNEKHRVWSGSCVPDRTFRPYRCIRRA